MQYQSSCAPRLARKCEIEHWFSCGADGRVGGLRAVYGHVITKFSRMGRFTYPWCSAGALRAPELRHEDSHREDPIRLYVIFTVQIRSKATMVRKCQNAKRFKATCILIFSLTTNFLITKSCLSRNNTETSCEEHVKL